MILRRATVSDLPALLDVQERGAVAGLSNVFPQDAFPFPRTVVLERWKTEIADPEVRAYVSTDDTGSITGFAATRGDELFHFGTAVESWGTGLAQELHDAVVHELTNSLPSQTTHLRLRVFEENQRARRFYEKLGWMQTDIRTRTSFEPHPVLVEYHRQVGVRSSSTGIRVAILDFDGTIVNEDLTTLLAGINGKRDESDALNRAFQQGRLSGITGLIERTRLLAGVPLSKVDEVLQGLDCLMPGAQALFDFFHQNNIVTIVASGSMMPILQHYQRLLGIDYLIGTTPTIRDGVIAGMTDEDAPRDGFKLAGVTSILSDLDISFDQAIAIGDSPADRDLLMRAAVAIAINPVGDIEEVADHVLTNDLSPVIGIIEAKPDRLKRLYSLIAEPYTERYADDRSDAPIIDTFAEAVRPGTRILDLGCGPGTFTSYLDELGFEAIGVDLSPEMLGHAKRRLPHLSFEEMDMRRLQFDDETFDGVLAAYSLIHIPDDEIPDVLTELRRVLRPNGNLLIIGQAGDTDHLEDDPLAPGACIFVNFFSANRLRNHLERAAFQIDRVDTKSTDDTGAMSEGVIWTLAHRQN